MCGVFGDAISSCRHANLHGSAHLVLFGRQGCTVVYPTCCKAKFPDLVCRAVSAQFMSDDRIAMFELTLQDGEVKVVEEKHYRLVPAGEIRSEDLQGYNLRAD